MPSQSYKNLVIINTENTVIMKTQEKLREEIPHSDI